MVEFNFGKSNFEKNAPGVTTRDSVIMIPESGDLRDMPDYVNFDLDCVQAIEPVMLGRDYICLTKPGGNETEQLMIRWISERGEWVGIYHRNWLESMSYGDDDSYSGPFRLEEYHGRKIIDAYGITPVDIDLDKVLYTGPDELERLMPVVNIPIIADNLQEDLLIRIPVKGNIDKYIDDVPEGEPEIILFSGHTGTDKHHRSFHTIHTGELYILWIDERNEWIGIKYSQQDNNIEASGPFNLGIETSELINKAYKTDFPGLIVTKKSPSELMRKD